MRAYLALIHVQSRRFHPSEEQVEDLQDEIIPRVEHHVVCVRSESKESIQDICFAECADQFALQRRIFCLLP